MKELYYDDQLSKVLRKFGYQVFLNVRLVLLSWATGSVSSGNLWAFDDVCFSFSLLDHASVSSVL